MKFEIRKRDLLQASRDKQAALIVLWPDDAKGAGPLAQMAQQARQAGDFKPSVGEVLASYGIAQVASRQVHWVACGDGQAPTLRQSLRKAWARLPQGAGRWAVQWAGSAPMSPAQLQALVGTIDELAYTYTHTLSQSPAPGLDAVILGLSEPSPAHRHALALAQALCMGVALAKEWANRPANHATPTLLAQAAQALSAHDHVRCKVLGPDQARRLGMGAFLAVAQGSAQAPQFIVLEYKHPKAKGAPVVLVGKGITFDTGGISLKPAAEMDEMKFDMAGAASVLGTFEALGRLQAPLHVVGLIPAAENMPGPQAVKPGDVVTSMAGQTIEILNTDAEGRLVLCDALCYAERYKPRAVIDVATLTGACVIALGAVRSGLFASDDALAADLMAAGEDSGDLAWRMPLDEAYAEGLKSRFADVANVGGRAAGAVTAAKFLQRFAKAYPWAHLDIAGTAWKSGAAKGATGRPVPLLLSYLLQRA